MSRPRVVVLRGQHVNPWELRSWEQLEERFEVIVPVAGAGVHDLSGMAVQQRPARTLADLVPSSRGAALAARLPQNRYRDVESLLRGADVVHAAELSFWFTAQAARLKASLGFRLVTTVWETIPFRSALRFRLARGNRETTWAEAWKLQWSPEHEIALVEAILLGETVELATAYKFKQLLDAATGIAVAAAVVRDACQCGLSASMDLARKRLQELSAVSSDLAAIAGAATALSQVARYGDVRKFDPAPLLPLIDELFVQGALALVPAANCDNAAAAQLTDSIEELNRISLEHHERVEGELWVAQLRKLSDADDRNPLLSGFACAVLLERGLIATEDLAREVSRRLSPGIPADLGAGWFEGLSKRNRAALLARQPLWVELAGYVQSLDDDQFKRAIVFLRRAFGGFSPQQKRGICENLAELWGVHADDAKEALEGPLNEAEQQKLTDLNEFSFDDI